MKKLFLTFSLLMSITIITHAQTATASEPEKLILENEKVKVTEYTSLPAGNVCGKDMHNHAPHLTVLLTNAEIELRLPDGKTIQQKAPAGTTFWSEAETHAVKNVGTTPIRVQLITIK